MYTYCMKTIMTRLSKDVHDFITSKKKHTESIDQILRRLLKIE